MQILKHNPASATHHHSSTSATAVAAFATCTAGDLSKPSSSSNMRLSTSIFSPPTTTTHPPKLRKEPVFLIQAIKRSPGPIQELGIQKEAEKDLSKILRTEFAIKNIEKKVSSKKYKNLWPKPVLEALDEAIKQKKWQLALKIFGLLRQQQWYQARCQTYTKLIVMLGKCKQPVQASLLFEVMLSDGLKPSVDVYTALASAYGQSGLLDEAFSTINDMKSVSDCKPDVYTYSILIKSCAKFHRFDLIGRILAEMSYLGIECSTVTYNTIIDGYGKAKKFEEMVSSFSTMVESDSCHPDIFTLNSMISAYGNSGNIEKMEKWYDEFNLMGVKADVQTFNILIKSYGRAGMYDKMRSVMDFMQQRFFSPTVVTYNIVIETFGKAGNIEKMEEHFKKMKHIGMKPNSITYCSLVSAYSEAGLIMTVDSILRQVENSDVTLDTPFFNCIISAYGRVGDVEKMGELFLAMKERHCVPDSITFAVMIQAYNAIGMTEAAQNLENKMIAMKENSEEDKPSSVSRILDSHGHTTHEARVRAIRATSALPRTKIVLFRCNPTMHYAYVRQHEQLFLELLCTIFPNNLKAGAT